MPSQLNALKKMKKRDDFKMDMLRLMTKRIFLKLCQTEKSKKWNGSEESTDKEDREKEGTNHSESAN